MTAIAFTRPAGRLARSVRIAESMGFEVHAAPSLQVIRQTDEEFRRIHKRMTGGSFDVIVFTSATSVKECGRALGEMKMPPGTETVSIGPGTSRSLISAGIRDWTVPREYSSFGLAEHFKSSANGKRILIVRSDRGSQVLKRSLIRSGAEVEEFAAYRLRPAGMSESFGNILSKGASGGIDVFAFTSPFSAASFVELSCKAIGTAGTSDMLSSSKVAAIGKPTASELSGMGVRVDIIPRNATFIDMLRTIEKNGQVME